MKMIWILENGSPHDPPLPAISVACFYSKAHVFSKIDWCGIHDKSRPVRGFRSCRDYAVQFVLRALHNVNRTAAVSWSDCICIGPIVHEGLIQSADNIRIKQSARVSNGDAHSLDSSPGITARCSVFINRCTDWNRRICSCDGDAAVNSIRRCIDSV